MKDNLQNFVVILDEEEEEKEEEKEEEEEEEEKWIGQISFFLGSCTIMILVLGESSSPNKHCH